MTVKIQFIMKETKRWYQSKGFWGAAGLAALGVYLIAIKNDIPTGMGCITVALSLWGIRKGETPIR